MAEITDKDIGQIISNLDVNELKEQSNEPEVEPLAFALDRISGIARRLGASKKLVDKIAGYDRTIDFDIPVVLERRAGGKELMKIFSGFWIEHNSILGKYKGDISFMPGLSIEKAKLSALHSTLQNAMLELPFGGAAGGISINKRILTLKEMEGLAKNYINSLLKIDGSGKDIFSAGAGCEERMMSLMYETYKSKVKGTLKSDFLGKQMQDGGIRARSNAVALGIFFMINEALKGIEVSGIPGLQKHDDIIKKSQKEMKVALMGFGDVEKELSIMLSSAGYKIIAISDSLGGAASASGMYAEDAARWQRNHSSVAGMPKTVKLSREQMLEVRADVLVVSSPVEINTKNMHKIKASVVVELLPVISASALAEISKSRAVVPYILSSSVRAYADYLEFLQNKEDKYFDRKEIDKKLEEKTREIFRIVDGISRQHAVNLQDACYILALQNLAKI
ncbi:MAG: Glu/Leu/Phe/Val dehydrogenase dimerization domain-containing protein [archaeon]